MIGKNCKISDTAKINENVLIEDNVTIGDFCVIEIIKVSDSIHNWKVSYNFALILSVEVEQSINNFLVLIVGFDIWSFPILVFP